MEKMIFTLAHDDAPVTMDGEKFEFMGIELVVHKTISPNHANWCVSELSTGRIVDSAEFKADAIDRAKRLVSEQYSLVLSQIAKAEKINS